MNIDRITTLLASGLKPANVATIVGCSPARISQLATSQEFQDLLASKTAEAEAEDIEEKALSTKYHAAEHVLLNQIMEMAPVSELRDVTAALRVVAERQEKAKTRLNPVQGTTIINQTVQIAVPAHTLPEISLTKDLEVTSVNALNLAPLTSEGVTNLFKKMKGEKEVIEAKEITNEPDRIFGEAEAALTETLQKELSNV
jgi:hypothetical protein